MDGCEKYELDMIDYLDGALDGERLTAFSAHLGNCPACSHRLEMMRMLMDETAELSVEMPDGLHDQIMARIERERKHGRILNFASRRTLAAAAAILLVFAASIYGVSRLSGGNDADSASMELTALNYKSSAALDEELTEDSADAGAGEQDGSVDAYDVSEELEDDMAVDDAVPSEYGLEEYREQDEADLSVSQSEIQRLLSDVAEDVRYAAVVVMDAEEVPDVLQEYMLVPADVSAEVDETAKTDEVLYTVVPTDQLDVIVAQCSTEEIELMCYDAENPVPDADVIDDSAETTLFVVRITE